MNILVVDDDFMNRKLLQSQLSLFGECDIAVDGEEAILAFKLAWGNQQPYDLICMDIRMPNIDGKEALKKIRQMEDELGSISAVLIINFLNSSRFKGPILIVIVDLKNGLSG